MNKRDDVPAGDRHISAHPSSCSPPLRGGPPARGLRRGLWFVLFVSGVLGQFGNGSALVADDFTTRIQPLLIERCGSCHGESRQRGELALHTPADIAKGGENGSIFVAGKPAESEIVRRLRLPIDDIDHMPPKGKPQLNDEEIKAIEGWIEAGATFEPAASAPAAPIAKDRGSLLPAERQQVDAGPAERSSPGATRPAASQDEPPPADINAINALRDHLVHVEAVSAGSNRLQVNFAAAARTITEAQVRKLLEPVLPQLESLSLARCAVGDETARLLARAPHLSRLDMRSSNIGDAGVQALSRVGNLSVLILAQTRLTDAAAAHLAAFAGLERLYVWQAGLSDDAVAELRRHRPQLQIDTGSARYATTQAVEPEIQLTSDAPLPDGAKPAAPASPPVAVPAQSQPAAALKPINTKCPVSGKPVDARYIVVHGDRVIGFCCPNCPGPFWANPAKFEAKLAEK